MPLMSRDDHENLLNELMNPEIEHTRRTEILQQLRVDHSTGHADYEQVNRLSEKLKADNQDLIVSNSKLFRQIGVVGTEKEQEEEKKDFSETITLEQIERGY
jgi:hypothetical protein